MLPQMTTEQKQSFSCKQSPRRITPHHICRSDELHLQVSRVRAADEIFLLPAGSEPNSDVADPVKDAVCVSGFYLLCIRPEKFYNSAFFRHALKKMLICFFEKWKEKKTLILCPFIIRRARNNSVASLAYNECK